MLIQYKKKTAHLFSAKYIHNSTKKKMDYNIFPKQYYLLFGLDCFFFFLNLVTFFLFLVKKSNSIKLLIISITNVMHIFLLAQVIETCTFSQPCIISEMSFPWHLIMSKQWNVCQLLRVAEVPIGTTWNHCDIFLIINHFMSM